MITYKLQTSRDGQPCAVFRLDGWSIPFAPANTDYQQFRKGIVAGVELEDATGTAMTADQIKAFLETLP